MAVALRANAALRLEPDEQRNCYLIAAASLAVFVAVWQPWESSRRLLAVALSALFPAALAFAASRGHRVWTAAAALLLVLSPGWGWLFVVAAVPLVYAFLLGRRGRQLLTQQGQPTQT